MSGNYATPAPVDETDVETRYFKLRSYVGTLLAFRVTGYDPAHVNPRFTKDGARPTVYADVLVVDGPDRGREWHSVEITAQYVVPRLSPNVGKVTLGRISKGSSAFFLDDPEPADFELADQVVAERSGESVDSAAVAEPPVPDEPPF